MGKTLIALVILIGVSVLCFSMFMAGYEFHQPREIIQETIIERWHDPEVKEVEVEAPTPEPEIIIKEIETTVYRYPNTPPYEAFADPIDFDQALVLLHGMRTSHIQILDWTFDSDPGFGIADKDVQEQFIKWYDQLIDIFWRLKNNGR